MTKSMLHRERKFFAKEVITDLSGNRYIVPLDGRMIMDVPAHKVGKQFPYENQRRSREVAALEEAFAWGANAEQAETAVTKLTTPHPKTPSQLAAEMRYLGRDGHMRPKKKPTHMHGGDGTVRRSSLRKANRPVVSAPIATWI